MEIQIVCTTVTVYYFVQQCLFSFRRTSESNDLMLTNKILVAGWIFHIFLKKELLIFSF